MNAVVKREGTAVPAAADLTPMAMLQMAVQQNADLDKLQKLMELQERWEASNSRKAFVVAMTAFKADPPAILKSKQVNIPGGAKFAHATLADVVDGVCAALSQHGLSHKWETSQQDGNVTVTCIITHEHGHSERTTLSAAPDDSGKKNGIQQIASTVTYLERYTLMAATGLAAKDMDDDGAGAGGTGAEKKVSEEQIASLEALITETGTDHDKFLRLLKVNELQDILACNYRVVLGLLEAKRK